MLCELRVVAAQIRSFALVATLIATLMRLALRLAALALSLVGALVAALTRPAPRLVALGEDHFSSQESILATSDDAAGSDLALLDGWASSSQFRVSDYRPARPSTPSLPLAHKK
jgi:hypothetical protein